MKLMRVHAAALGLVAALALAPAASATVTVYFSPALATIPEVGQTTVVDIVADFDAPIAAWGLDLSIADTLIASQLGAPTLGAGWDSVFTPDGDGLAGLSFPLGIGGTGVVLATITFIGNAEGSTGISLGITPTDETEGFGYELGGLADVTFVPGTVEVLPEPASLTLLGLAALALRRRS